MVLIGLQVDLDPPGEVLSVNLERLARPSPSSEPGDFSRWNSREPEHDGEHSRELVAAALLRAVEYPVGDIAVLIESVDPSRAVVVQSEVGAGVAVDQVVLDRQHLIPCAESPGFVDYRLSYFFDEITALAEEIVGEIVGVAAS